MDILEITGLTATRQTIDEASKTRTIFAEIIDNSEQTVTCPYCGAVNSGGGTAKHTFRDVPLRGHIVIIELELRRLTCQSCRKMFRQTPIGLDPERLMTCRCVEWIRQRSLCAPFSLVAEEIGCSEAVVQEIAHEYIEERETSYRSSMPHWLGIDELYLDGRIDKPLLLLIDLENSQLIEILPNCRKATLASWLSSFNQTSQLRGVCMGLCEGHRRAVKQVFPNAEIVLDKLHVLRWADNAVDSVRLRVRKRHPSEGNVDYRKILRVILRKRWHSLTLDDRRALNDYFSRHPEIAIAYRLKEQFFEIYNCKSRSDAITALEDWEQSVPESMHRAFKVILHALTNWRKEILAYFGNEKTLAFTEAIESQIHDEFRLGESHSFEIVRGKLLFGRKAPRLRKRRRAA